MKVKQHSLYKRPVVGLAIIAALSLLSAFWLVAPGGYASASGRRPGSGLVPPPEPTRQGTPLSTATATRTVAPGSTAIATNTPGIPRPVPTGQPTPCAMNFSDVQPSDWFYGPVNWIVCNRVAGGYSDNTFRPGLDTTRGQIAKMIALAAGWSLRNPAAPTFSDVPAGSPFFAFVETAAAHGIISGYTDGTFRPGSNVTRGQLSKVVVLARSWTLSNPDSATFSDVPLGSTFFPYVETAVLRGIVSGYTDGTFHPGSSATRAQLSKIAQRAFTTTAPRTRK